jgi:hypothetical protein
VMSEPHFIFGLSSTPLFIVPAKPLLLLHVRDGLITQNILMALAKVALAEHTHPCHMQLLAGQTQVAAAVVMPWGCTALIDI